MTRHPSCCAFNRRFTRRGFAMSDLIAVCVCAGMLFSIVIPMTGSTSGDDAADQVTNDEPAKEAEPEQRPWPSRSTRTRDATQVRMIHQAMLVFAREFDGVMPLPGLIRRLPVNGQHIPGRGEQDITLNTTANLYSAMVMQNYFTPELLISPWERSDKVKVHAKYNWDAYDVAKATYWDDTFTADLTRQSNASYAHLLLTPKRQDQWRDHLRSDYIQLSNRGPIDGKGDAASITCNHEGNWAGNIVFGDNASMWMTAMTHKDITTRDADGNEIPDNFFAGEAEDDVLMTFTQAIDKQGKATIQHD